MLSPTAPIFGSLAHATGRALAGLDQSLKRTLTTDGAERALQDGDGGKHAYAARLGSLSRSKRVEYEIVQTGLSYLQIQEAGLRKVEGVMDRMGQLAGLAVDPSLSATERTLYMAEFDDLKKSLYNLQNSTFQDHYLFQESADFSSGLNETNLNPKPPDTYEANVFSAELGRNINRWTATKDVRYDRGKLTLQVNSGTAWERYAVRQGDDNVIFDTGQWKTAGSAYNQDFDQFVIEWSPGEVTTYKYSHLDSDADGVFDNEPYHLNESSDGSYVENFQGTPIATRSALRGETNLSVIVESKSLFQVSALYEAVLSKDVIEVPTGAGSVTIQPMQFSTLYDVSVDTAANASNASAKIIDEVENLAGQLGSLGASMRQLELAADHLARHMVTSSRNMERLEERLVDDILRTSKEEIRLQGNLALTAQARTLNRNLMTKLL